MRLSVLYREPLHRVMDWPASEVRLIAAYLAREPAPDERIEIAVAHLSAIYTNAHLQKGSEQKPIADFLLFRKAWTSPHATQDGRYSDSDQKMLASLMTIKGKNQ